MRLMKENLLRVVGVNDENRRPAKGPRRYLRAPQKAGNEEGGDSSLYVEERFGRNLDLSFVNSAKAAVRRRIAGTLRSDVELEDVESARVPGRDVEGFTENDVYLFPTGMSAIFNTHQILMNLLDNSLKSVCYG